MRTARVYLNKKNMWPPVGRVCARMAGGAHKAPLEKDGMHRHVHWAGVALLVACIAWIVLPFRYDVATLGDAAVCGCRWEAGLTDTAVFVPRTLADVRTLGRTLQAVTDTSFSVVWLVYVAVYIGYVRVWLAADRRPLTAVL